MADENEFQSAVDRVQKLPKKPGNDALLELYGLYKQATTGDVSGKRPGMLDLRGRAKFDAWASRKGMSAADARAAYVSVVERLERSS
ncbi:MAG: acyl-CoA-binding protein [Sandaracinaceae bacterium]|nr:MAG: acyl-CoA-binding protein [Sandaracinaceae bacterium]